MSGKGLKPAIARPSARDALAAAHAVAQEAGLPPAALPARRAIEAPTALQSEDDGLVQVNIRVRRRLGDELADRARLEGATQKILICRALAAAGFDVHPDDLHTGPRPRRRGTT
jgi:hypothetical protein